MRYALLWMLFLLGCTPENSNFLPTPYQLDGALTIPELWDTVRYKTVVEDEDLIIKESQNNYYIGIRSNAQTIANAYYKSDDQLKIMHASAALGEVNYNFNNGTWKKDRADWEWRFRDQYFWDKLHTNPITQVEAYFREFGWTANTISNGSEREMEMLVSKKIVKDFNKLCVSYTKKLNDSIIIIIGPSGSQLTPDASINMEIHNGYLPEEIDL